MLGTVTALFFSPMIHSKSVAQGEWEGLAEEEEEKGEDPNVPEAATAVTTPLGFRHWKCSQCM